MTQQEIEAELLTLARLEQIHELTMEKLTTQLTMVRELIAGHIELRNRLAITETN
jgi:hypothetical protein